MRKVAAGWSSLGGRRFAGTVVAAILCVGGGPAWAFKVLNSSATFAGGSTGATLQSLTMTVFRSSDSGPPGVPIPIQLEYQTGGGSAIGGPIAGTLPADGVLLLSTPSIPSAAIGLGNRLLVGGSGEPTTAPVAWYQGQWSWVRAQIVVFCNTMPCRSSSSHWMIQGSPTIAANDSTIGPRTATVVASGFDLSWVAHLDVLTATVIGSSSFIRLSDGTNIAFPAGETFAVTGAFVMGPTAVDPLGLSGPYQITASTESIIGSPVQTFPAPATSVMAAAAPAAVPALNGGPTFVLAVALLIFGVLPARASRPRSRQSPNPDGR